MSVVFREFAGSDLTAVAKLLRLTWHRDSLPDFLIEEKIEREADSEPSLTLCGFAEETLAAFGMAVAKERPEGKMGYIKLFAVHPLYQRKGIGKNLLGILETGLRARGCRTVRLFESYPNYLCPGVDPFYTSAVSFFERSGYKKFNDTSNLTVNLLEQDFDTAADEERLAREGVLCRRAAKEDYHGVQRWMKEHFPAWTGEMDGAFQNAPPSMFLGEKNGEIIAFSAFEGNNRGTSWFGPMGTQPGIRGGGVGAVLLKQCLRALKDMGFVKAVIPWVGPIPFYQHHVNAQVDRVFWRYEKKLE